MPNSLHSSTASAAFRLDWPPSRLLALSYVSLGLLAAASTLASEMPGAAATPVAVLAVAWGGWLGRREWRRPEQVLCVDADGAATLDGIPLAVLEIRWRGSLGFARWRDAAGQRGCLIGAPDVLDPAMRRDLRLVEGARAPARTARSMAP